MPLSRLQSDILVRLASHRSPDYVEGPRFSSDIDIFHDREEQIALAADTDGTALRAAGFDVQWQRRELGFHSALIGRGGETMRLEWARDSDFRFFPTIPDPVFGFMLHVVDIATDKALAAAGRREPRDVLDLLYIDEVHLPLGAVIWAAVGKDAGLCPDSLIAEIRRNARYRADDYLDLGLVEPVDAGLIARRFRDRLNAAEAFARAMPAGKEGLLFLDEGRPGQPDPATLARYAEHVGQRRGHWPTSPDIGGAMLDPRRR